MTIAGSSTMPPESSLIESLSKPEAYPHPTQSIALIETHISWVLLSGPFAYKIKKPVELGFLDFRDLDARLFYCREELRLNRPWAPEIYIDVVPITAPDGKFQVNGDGPAVEYAVRMHQFDQQRRLDLQLDADLLSCNDMDQLAASIAERHQSATVIGPAGCDDKLAHIRDDMWDNLNSLEGQPAAESLQPLRQWTGTQLDRLEPLLRRRFAAGFVRECHGDLHLSNLVRLPAGIAAFDCIEFGAEFRNIDVMCDVAFLVMDLVSRQRSDLAWRFLNRYLELTGDYAGMQVFTLYFTYRCLVRAKVAAIRGKEREHGKPASNDLAKVRKYCAMAQQHTQQPTPTLIVMHGLSGSGKTWLSTRLMAALPAVRLRSDIERKRMFGLQESAHSGSAIAQGLYTEAASDDLYARLQATAEVVIGAGHDTILDAAYLTFAERERARRLAACMRCKVIFVETSAAVETRRERIRKRGTAGDDASEADLAVLEYQTQHVEHLRATERQSTLRVDTGDEVDIVPLLREIRLASSACGCAAALTDCK